MAVRKTESRIPQGFSTDDLGQAAVSSDGQSALISFYCSPIAQGRVQTYVTFVLDPPLQNRVATYRWQVRDDTADTHVGIWEFTPADIGSLEISVSLLDNGGTTLQTLTLSQEVVALNPELENLIAQDDAVHPIAGDPTTSREIINDVRAYMDELAPRDADPSNSLNCLLFAITYVGTLQQSVDQRNTRLEKIAAALTENDATTLGEEGSAGIGVCRVRPHTLGMFLPVTPGGTDWYLSKREYPTQKESRLTVHRRLLQELRDLAPEKQIDLFNLLRFPKSNLKMAIQLLEGLKAQYFPADSLEAVINDKNKALALLDQFKEGPHQTT